MAGCIFFHDWEPMTVDDFNTDIAYRCTDCGALKDINGRVIGPDDDNDSSCFITTAVCKYKGLPDDCYELNILRNFRDTHLLKTEDGRDLVNNYYQISPSIAKNLIQEADFEYTWDNIISCIKSIEANKKDEATFIYKNMVLSLQKKLSSN